MSELPSIRWGILGTGFMSVAFIQDLVNLRPSAPVRHIVTAIGTSSTSKATSLIEKAFAKAPTNTLRPKIYTEYAGVYADPSVDVVYVATPHSAHRQNCLDAIAAGKNVLCEKPFMINLRETDEVFKAAQEKGVFIMEALWTRFFPLVRELQSRLHDLETPLLGTLRRFFCDFSLDFKLKSQPSESRLGDRNYGAGALLGLGIYPITLAGLLLGGNQTVTDAAVTSKLVLNEDGIDVFDSITLHWSNPDRVAILTASLFNQTPRAVARLEGSRGTIVIEGHAASHLLKAIITTTAEEGKTDTQEEILEPKLEGAGVYFEADAVALDIMAGRKENSIMPWEETRNIMRLMDKVRKDNGLIYPQDEVST